MPDPEPTLTKREASLVRSILALAEGLSPDARLWLAEWLRTHPFDLTDGEDAHA